MQPTTEGKKQGKVGRFFRDVVAELKKVAWPNKKTMITYTIVVIVTVLAVATIIFGWDAVLTFLFKSMGFYRQPN